jgi:hypothetical protein
MNFRYAQRKRKKINPTSTQPRDYTVVPGYSGPQVVELIPASERMVKRSPNSAELRNNLPHRIIFDATDGVTADDIAAIVAWSEAVEVKSTELYPLERISTMRLHMARRGVKSQYWCITFRHSADMQACVEAFPVLQAELDRVAAKAARNAQFERINDVGSRVADAREDEATDDRLGRLRGTDKQVAWAGDIRREYIERGRCDPTMLPERSASVWIDKRDDI